MPTLNKPKKKVHLVSPYKHRKRSQKYYNTKRWKNLRNSYIKRNPLCVCCLEHFGKVTEATEVHHRTPFLRGITEEQKEELLLDEKNLMSVCKKCHLAIHNGEIPEYINLI